MTSSPVTDPTVTGELDDAINHCGSPRLVLVAAETFLQQFGFEIEAAPRDHVFSRGEAVEDRHEFAAQNGSDRHITDFEPSWPGRNERDSPSVYRLDRLLGNSDGAVGLESVDPVAGPASH